VPDVSVYKDDAVLAGEKPAQAVGGDQAADAAA
jgi:hypothetical protein